MNKIMEKMENVVEKYIQEFESNPLKTSIKILIVLFVLKSAYNLMKKD